MSGLSGLDRFNRLPEQEAAGELLAVCHSRRWAEQVAAGRPYADLAALQRAADEVWTALSPTDWLEAFGAHPRIGEGGGASPAWSSREQAGVGAAGREVRERLARLNAEYEARFGHVFLIAAAGRDAGEILDALRVRLGNDPATELEVAAGEHRRITRLRLEQLVGFGEPQGGGPMSLTTHVLDTARGRPAAGVRVTVEARSGDGWTVVGGGVTDDDGRVPGLVADGALAAGEHRLTFATGDWFEAEGLAGFYPQVTVVCRIDDPEAHCHVPLLLSPYGYSTYRGS